MAGVTLRWDAVSPAVARALRLVSAPLAESSFYLAGGTALALRYGHRRSIDIDLFAPALDTPEALLARLRRELPELTPISTAPRTVEASVAGVPVSLFEYPYPLVAPLVTADPGIVPLAATEDIAAMKLAAIASRGSRKDFTDLWLIVGSGLSLAECLSAFQGKFATRDLGHVVRSLVYFDDADAEPPLDLILDVSWETIKDDLRRTLQETVRL